MYSRSRMVLRAFKSAIGAISSIMMSAEYAKMKECPEMSCPCQWRPALLQLSLVVCSSWTIPEDTDSMQEPVTFSMQLKASVQIYQIMVATTRDISLLKIFLVFELERRINGHNSNRVQPQDTFTKYKFRKFLLSLKYVFGTTSRSLRIDPRNEMPKNSQGK